MRYEDLDASLIIGPGLGVMYAFIAPLRAFRNPDLEMALVMKLSRFEWGRLVSGFLYSPEEFIKYQSLLGWKPLLVGVGPRSALPGIGPGFDGGLALQLQEMDGFIRGFRVGASA